MLVIRLLVLHVGSQSYWHPLPLRSVKGWEHFAIWETTAPSRSRAVHSLSTANDRLLLSHLPAIYLLDLIAASHGILHRYLACGLKLFDGFTSECGIDLGI